MQDELERRGSVVCVCVLILYPAPCIYSREPRVRTFTTDVRDQWGGAPLVEVVGPTGQVSRLGRSVGLPGPPTVPNFFWQAVLGLLVWSTLGLACLDLSELGSCITFGPSEPKSVL